MAGVTRQAVSAVESGHSDPALRVALASVLGATVKELFGRGELADPVRARPVAPTRPGERVALATIGDTFVALPLRGETAALTGFSAAGGLVPSHADASAAQTGDIPVRPISPPRPTFIPLAAERFDLVTPAKLAASREVQGLLKVLTSPWLLTQLASLPGYKAAA
jgi:hypothetical protein